jgi:RNA polymerase sigma factor (sigma-70 family)
MEGTPISDRYRLLRIIGKGTTGEVWLGHDGSLNREVAIKLIDPKFAENAEVRARFLREAQLAARISSAHVVQIFDHGLSSEGRPFMAMEYLVGRSLRDRLAEDGSLSLHETMRLLSPLCLALAAAHEAGLVHRDLKPENVFLVASAEGQAEGVKILDFGVAKAIGLSDSPSVGTATGDLLGTPSYMSPEQALGAKSVDHRTDIWALGVIVFECLTGVRPFEAPTLGSLVAKILTGPIPVPSRAAPEAALAPEIDAWTACALARDPSERFASAADLAASFGSAVQQSTHAPAIRDDSAIRKAFAAGDLASAANLVVGQLGAEVLRFFVAQLGDTDLANDAFSMFCERVWTALPRFEWRSSVRTWCYVIARRALVDLKRVEGRRGRRRDPLTETHLSAIAEQVRSATLPLLKTEGRRALDRLRGELPHEDKMLLVLRLDRGLAWEELARVSLANDSRDEAPNEAELRRESARLRKRFQLVKARLRERAEAEGLVRNNDD